jgi:hypothetical protein
MTGRCQKPGGMGPFIEGYRRWLAGGSGLYPWHGRQSTCWRWLAASADGWMSASGPAPGDLDRAAITEFRASTLSGSLHRSRSAPAEPMRGGFSSLTGSHSPGALHDQQAAMASE